MDVKLNFENSLGNLSFAYCTDSIQQSRIVISALWKFICFMSFVFKDLTTPGLALKEE